MEGGTVLKELFDGINISIDEKLKLLNELLAEVKAGAVTRKATPIAPQHPEEKLSVAPPPSPKPPIALPVEPEEPIEIISTPEPSIEAFESVIAPVETEIPSQEPTSAAEELPFVADTPAIADESLEMVVQSPAEMALEATDKFIETHKDEVSWTQEQESIPLNQSAESKGFEVTSSTEMLQEQFQSVIAKGPGLITEEMSKEDAFKTFAEMEREAAAEKPSSFDAAPPKIEGPLHPEASVPPPGELITEELSDEEAFKRFAALEKGGEAEPLPSTTTVGREPPPEPQAPPPFTDEPAPPQGESEPEIAISDFFADSQGQSEVQPLEPEKIAEAKPETEQTIGQFFDDILEEGEEEEKEPTLGDFFSGLD
ncbi:MAG: hypothetical protein Kow0090_21440 [Myxococcota bacterium]